jgi:hypothetical protein
MRQILLTIFAAALLFAQTGAENVRAPQRDPAAEGFDARLARLEVAVPQLEKQLDDMSKTLIDVRLQLADLNTKMNLALWIGSAIGALLLGSVWKLITEKRDSSHDFSTGPRRRTEHARAIDLEDVRRLITEELQRRQP